MKTTKDFVKLYNKDRDYIEEISKKEKEGIINEDDGSVLKLAIEHIEDGRENSAIETIDRADTFVRDLFSVMMNGKGIPFVLDEW